MNITTLPVLILRNNILFPHDEIRLELDNEQNKELIKIACSYYDKYILIVNYSDVLDKDNNINKLPQIGVLGNITMNIELPNNKTRIVIKGINRLYINSYDKEDLNILASVSPINYEKIEKVEENAFSRSLIKQVEYYIDKDSSISNSILSTLNPNLGIDTLTDLVSPILKESYERKLEYLYEINPVVRVCMILEDINEELKIVEFESMIEEHLSKNLDDYQKNFLLQEKLKVVKEELGISYDKDEEYINLKEKIDKVKCPLSVKNKLNEELKKYESTSVNSPECSIIRSYIDLLLNLPWNKSTTDNKDLILAKKILDETHYGLNDVKDRIIEYLALRTRTKNTNSSVICLVGPPGVGKTTLCKSIAKAMNRKYVKISVGGLNDSSEIMGNRRTYIGAFPGKIIQGIKKCGSNNPVFVIDEIDKLCKDIKGDPASSLLEVLDKEQNKYFVDNYVEECFDLSKVMFITTANDVGNIPEALKDRLEIIEIEGYSEYEKLNICKSYLIKKELEENALTFDDVTFTDKAYEKIIKNYTKESGIRSLERMIDKILRKIVTELAINNKNKKYVIDEKQVLQYLGKEKYSLNNNTYSNTIGIVNALSYTTLGGEVLKIEINTYKGNGNIITTGLLGDVFKESVKIALSYIKSNCDKLKIDFDMLNNIDIHLHVPEGAVKKEGPSAGIAITTALISALKNKQISSYLALTGEITLRGNILPVGKIKEKIIGASNNNIKKVILPKENEKDVEVLDEVIKKNIKFVYVSNYEEVLKEIKL